MIKSNFKNSAFFILRFTFQTKPFLFDLKEMCNFKYFPKISKKNKTIYRAKVFVRGLFQGC